MGGEGPKRKRWEGRGRGAEGRDQMGVSRWEEGPCVLGSGIGAREGTREGVTWTGAWIAARGLAGGQGLEGPWPRRTWWWS